MTGGSSTPLQREEALAEAGFPDLDIIPGLRSIAHLPAAQQPSWSDHPDLACIRAELADLPGLVQRSDILDLYRELETVAAGEAYLLHVGECAELFSMATREHVERRLSLYSFMASRLATRIGRKVVLVARMAGQHAKPRSNPMEPLADGTEIPVYRGDAVNVIEADAPTRGHDPWRMLTSYDCSRETLEYMRAVMADGRRIFSSHEAMLRDYEEPLTRNGDVPYSASGHLPWIGERTRGLTDWHIQWASLIMNPVGVKVGPSATPQDVIDTLEILNKQRVPGRVSLITRMAASRAADLLHPLVMDVARSRIPVIWQCDPMHGNTRKIGGVKTRLLPEVRAEITAFVRTLRDAGCHPGGLHLEVTPGDVRECHEDISLTVTGQSSAPCDPRLNPKQAIAIVDHFAREVSSARLPGGRT